MAVTTAAEREAVEADAPASEEHAVTPLELFFDLVFVFALTQVTALLAAEPTWAGLAKGLLVLAALWWAWVGYSWLTNVIEPEHAAVRLAILVAMGGMFVAALAVPHAFGDDGLLFALALTLVRALHIVLFALAPNGQDFSAALVRFAPRAALAMALLVVASQLDGTAQGALWAVAITIDLTSAVGRRQVESWKVHAEHFAERHGLIFLIALGESIVALGVGAEGADLTAGVLTAVALGLLVSGCLWWMYFDVVAVVATRVLERSEGVARVKMARDSYSWLHLPMIAGVVLLALGLKKTLGDVGEPLKLVPALALGGGPALYLLAHVAFRLRNVGTIAKRRVVVAALCVGAGALATEVAALLALGVLAAILTGLVAFEAVRYAEARHRLRASRH